MKKWNGKNFTPTEFRCKCGHPDCQAQSDEAIVAYVDERLILTLDDLRIIHGEPIVITSGIRCKYHKIEIPKIQKSGIGGSHWIGAAVDVRMPKTETKQVSFLSNIFGNSILEGGLIKGIGVSDNATKRVLHIDVAHPNPARDCARFWTYP